MKQPLREEQTRRTGDLQEQEQGKDAILLAQPFGAQMGNSTAPYYQCSYAEAENDAIIRQHTRVLMPPILTRDV